MLFMRQVRDIEFTFRNQIEDQIDDMFKYKLF